MLASAFSPQFSSIESTVDSLVITELEPVVVRRLLNAIAEAISGHRPAHQLRTTVSSTMLKWLENMQQHQHSERLAQRQKSAIRLRSIRTSSPRNGIIEAAGTAVCGNRIRALAACLEFQQGTWLCTLFRLL